MFVLFRVLLMFCFASCITGCATVQRSTASSKAPYKKIWNACLDSVSDVRFSVSSTDEKSGLIIADSAVVAGQGTVSRLNIQLLKELTSTNIAVTYVPPYGTIGGYGTAARYVEAVKLRIPDLVEVNSNASGEQGSTQTKKTAPKSEAQPIQIQTKPVPEDLGVKSSQSVESKSSPQPSASMVAIKSNTKVRKSPSSKGAIIKTLKKGEEVQIVKRKDEWFLVELIGGETGWCHNSVLSQKE